MQTLREGKADTGVGVRQAIEHAENQARRHRDADGEQTACQGRKMMRASRGPAKARAAQPEDGAEEV